MIYELRTYRVIPGRMAALLERFEKHTLQLFRKHGIEPKGFWTTLIGTSSNELTYILAWQSLADREARWSAFQTDPDWLRVKAESERDGQINETITNQILSPTSFSELR